MKRATTAVLFAFIAASSIAATPRRSFDFDWGQKKIEAPAAWAAGIRGRGITIAVLSTGVNGNIPALRNAIYMNTKEIAWNGIDDDGNGYVDDTTGWNFVDDNPWVLEEKDSHGTQLASILVADPALGTVPGVAPEASLMILKIVGEKGTATAENIIRAMEYAANQGANIILCPVGGLPAPMKIGDEIDKLAARGILVVAAAGNDYNDLELFPSYPAGLIKPNLISVASSSSYDYLSYYSNYGEPVDFTAPGDSIWTYNIEGETEYMDGTVPASAFAAGAAALVWSQNRALTPNEVKKKLFESVDVVQKDVPVASKGRLNVRKALGLTGGS